MFPSLGLTALFTGSFYNEAESALAVELVGRFVLVSALKKEGANP
ncbi:hypothetical protein [Stigmatella aurantiaca]|uniref:Uncharacterized protein n=1 Tax=Stigmatella aurantiaca (strain DW4/3-1) TaxID=378806 RepID=Q093J0_STIAD|nr:hypothetical protein [Stigmatella aurantiaca]EAU66877.1 hypothetical protein STIAU_3185 [Stigmatella aurantiaca DW4/3-1]